MRLVRFVGALGALSCAAMGAVTACSDSASPASPTAPTGGAVVDGHSSIDPGANDTTAKSPDECTNIDALQIVFQPSYSAFDGQNRYRLPAIVAGIEASLIRWSTSDDSKVRHTPDESFGGEMFEMTGAGEVTIFAAAGNLCGHSVLRITQATIDQWKIGSARYNNGVPADRRITRPDSGADRAVACTNCHGATGSLGTVEHTPMQTGRFSDADLKNIFLNGSTPNGELAQPISNLTYEQWNAFHRWDVADDAEANGLVIYLRSLTPTPTGSADFGGALGGGGVRRDGGMRPDGAP